ncbi:MAG: PhoH family protein [Clostridiales bacterium]|nr:PhoH family protein [Clostridiales bacterium]
MTTIAIRRHPLEKEPSKSYVEFSSVDELSTLFGTFDANLKVLESETNVFITALDAQIEISGSEEDVEIAAVVIKKLQEMLGRKERIDINKIRYSVELAREGNAELISQIMSDVVLVTQRGKPIKCKTLGQQKYVNQMRKNTVVFCIGPAGTGKTYLAMAMAVLALKNKDVTRIILTRPAVEAGEKLGFLPGDLQNKVDPYLRPLYDALYEMMGPDTFSKLSERGIIEVAPMAYMRGRSLNDAFIVLDEAQNTTVEQMKMFLTRLGEGSKMVVTGDITQTDLPKDKKSGLKDAIEILDDVKDIGVTALSSRDVVRHELVRKIVNAYEKRFKRK